MISNTTLMLSCLFVSILSVQSFAKGANFKESGLKMVPESQLFLQDGDELTFQTPKGTLVEIEFNHDGSLDEASGHLALTGDVFSPVGDFMKLNEAVAALQKAGKTPSGDWTFEKSMLHGWVYEFEGLENGKMMEYIVDGKSGKLLKSKRDF